MIVGFDGSRAFDQKRTGTENYSFQLLKNLAQIDSKNKYIVYIRPGINPGSGWPGNFKFLILNFQFLWTQGGLSWQTFTDNLDILFIPAHTLPLIRKPGLKTVVTVHDLGSEYLPAMHQVKQRLYLKFIQKIQLKTATRLITVSKATRNDLVKKIGVKPKNVTVIYEGYDKKRFKPSKNDELKDTLIHYDLKLGRYFLFVGTVQPRKNLARLIEAFSLFRHSGAKQSEAIESRSYRASPSRMTIKLVIVGKKGWMSDEIYKLPEKLGIVDQVKFLDYVKDEDLPALYSGAIALTFPSLFEGFGLPILEAQACGTPVITSNISSMPEVAGKGALYVNPYDVNDIVKGMKRVMNAEFRVKSIKAGFENVNKFSWEKAAGETLKVFEEI